MTPHRPTLGAFLLAILAGIGLWFALYIVYAIFAHGPVRAAQQVPYLLMGSVLFAAPVALVVTLVLAVPAYLLLRGTDRITLPLVLAVGAAGGLLGRTAVVRLWGQPESSFVPIPVVVLAGAGAALVWWRAWNRTEQWTPKGTI